MSSCSDVSPPAQVRVTHGAPSSRLLQYEKDGRVAHFGYWNRIGCSLTPPWRRAFVQYIFEVRQHVNTTVLSVNTAIGIFDRFLAIENVATKELQLVVLLSLFIASKFHDVEPLTLDALFSHIKQLAPVVKRNADIGKLSSEF